MRLEQLPADIRQRVQDEGGQPFWFNVPFDTTIAEGTNAEGSRTTDANWYYAWEFLNGHVYSPAVIASGTEVYGDYPRNGPGTSSAIASGNFVEINIAVGNVNMMNEPAPFYLVCGSGERPAWLASPVIIAPQQSVNVSLYNRHTEADHDIRANVVIGGTRFRRR